MKTLQTILALLLLGLFLSPAKAQLTPAKAVKPDQQSYWQLSARAGYDHPLFKETFPYIDYKGGMMGGLSLNHYWNWIGLQADFDYLKNNATTNIATPTAFLTNAPSGPTLYPLAVRTQHTQLKRMFAGIGPAFKYQSKNNQITAELALMGGLGLINGGEILVTGENATMAPSTVILTYHTGFDHEKAITGKAQARITYFFNAHLGLNIGAYYLNHFGVQESRKNQLLVNNGYPSNNNGGYYYQEMGNIQSPDINKGLATFTNIKNEGTLRTYDDELGLNQREKIKLASLGAFAGLTYRIFPKKQKVLAPSNPVPTAAPIAKKYNLQVTAKDKFSKEVLPNTDIALKNSDGTILKTGKTDAFGSISFTDLPAANYVIEGLFNSIALEKSSTMAAEFKNNETLQKEILYANRNFIIRGKVFMCNSNTTLSGTSVVLENQQKAFKKATLSDAEGNFMLQLPEEGSYQLYSKKENFFSQIEEVNASNYKREQSLFVKLEICSEETECEKAISLKNILFDLDRYAIREDAKPELNKLVRFMQDNPLVKVELGSHTDSRGSDQYNLTLSQNRANASVAYIVSQGIAKNRIIAVGYGERQLLNECADGVACTEAQHQLNRRTTFKVICPK